MRNIWLVVVAGALAGCSGAGRDSTSTTAAAMIDPLALQATGSVADDDYRIGATDLLKVTVFQVPDLSFDEVRVDASGQIEMPLIGSVAAAGLTSAFIALPPSRYAAGGGYSTIGVRDALVE